MRMSQFDEESLAMIFSLMSMDIEHSFYGDSQNGSIFNTLYQSSYGAYNVFDYQSPQNDIWNLYAWRWTILTYNASGS